MITVHPDQLQQLVDECNAPFTSKMMNPNTFRVISVIPGSGTDRQEQRANVTYQFTRADGQTITRREMVLRYPLYNELAKRLSVVDGLIQLPSVSTALSSVLIAIEQVTGIRLMQDDVERLALRGNIIRIGALPLSLGWFGECDIAIVEAMNERL